MVSKTFRLNRNKPTEKRILEFLDTVPAKKQSIVFKEALDMYIEMINQGLYECPVFKEEVEVESKFKNILKKEEEPKQVVSPNTTLVKEESKNISFFNRAPMREELTEDMFFNSDEEEDEMYFNLTTNEIELK